MPLKKKTYTMNHKIALYTILSILIIGSLSSCYTEQTIAKRFVKETAFEKPAVWFIGADYLFKNCDIEPDTTEIACIMINDLNDSLLLENYNRNFAVQLESYGYQIYTYYEAKEFLEHDGLALIINVAQLEIEEFIEYYNDSQIFDTLEYFETLPVRSLKLNSWIEVSLSDTNETNQEVLFVDNKISDLIEGYFTQHPFRGDVKYTFKRYDMKPGLTNVFVARSGTKDAEKMFDLWMNRYLERCFSEYAGQRVPHSYYHFNSSKDRIEVIDAPERPIVLQQ